MQTILEQLSEFTNPHGVELDINNFNIEVTLTEFRMDCSFYFIHQGSRYTIDMTGSIEDTQYQKLNINIAKALISVIYMNQHPTTPWHRISIQELSIQINRIFIS